MSGIGIGYIPPGAFPVAVDPEDPFVEVEGRVLRPPPPGGESAGPPLTDLVVTVRDAVSALEALYHQARYEAMYRIQRGVTQSATDSNGTRCFSCSKCRKAAPAI